MDFNSKIPAHLTDKRNLVRLVVFTAVFALVFINIYSPFGVSERYDAKTELEFIFYSSLAILIGILVIVLSRVILYQLTKKNREITYLNFSFWIAGELFFMALAYTLYDHLVLDDPREVWLTFKLSLQNTALVLLLPYSVAWLYFSWKEKNRQLTNLTRGNEHEPEKKSMIHFKDENGKIKISIKTADLLYFQASDNYVDIFYSHGNKHSKYMLRTTLKQIELELTNQTFIRCHRSFIVNFEKVKIIRREKEGLIIELDTIPIIEIPVSKTYLEDVFKAFGHSNF